MDKNKINEINKKINMLQEEIKQLEDEKGKILNEEIKTLEKLAEPTNEVIDNIVELLNKLKKEIEKFYQKQDICVKCCYHIGEDDPEHDLDCPLAKYCMYYNNDCYLTELFKYVGYEI